MSEPPTDPELYRAASLAAAFLLHDLEGNNDGLTAVMEEVHGGGPILLGNFIRAVSGHALSFGRKYYRSPETLAAALRDLVLRYERER